MVRGELDLLAYGRNNAAWSFSRLQKNEVGARMLQWTARVALQDNIVQDAQKFRSAMPRRVRARCIPATVNMETAR
jgi:hypothetical protein